MRKDECQSIGAVIGHRVSFGNGDKASAVRKDDRLNEDFLGHFVRSE